MSLRCGRSMCLAGLFWAMPAAADCGRVGRPWVSVAFEGTSFTDRVESRMVEDFRAGLSDRAIDVCPAGQGPRHAPVAQIRVAQATATKVGVSVEVRDAVTEKRVSRDVDLSAVPKDGRAFAVALAADELLRASWVELALDRARPDASGAVERRPPPPEVAAVAESTLAVRRDRSRRFGFRAAAERFTGGQTHLGADAALVTALFSRWRIEVSAGLREALVVDAPHGRVVASTVGGGMTLGYLLIAKRSFELSLDGGGRAAWVRFRGDAQGESSESELSGLAAYLRAGSNLAARLSTPLWLEVGANVGAPLRALGARDGENVVTGVSGLELAARAGLAAEF